MSWEIESILLHDIEYDRMKWDKEEEGRRGKMCKKGRRDHQEMAQWRKKEDTK